MAINHDPIAFPKLDDVQIAALGKFATLKTFQVGETLFAAGERDFKFFVVKTGEVEIVDRSSGEDTIVTVHGSREFTGDVDMLTGRASQSLVLSPALPARPMRFQPLILGGSSLRGRS
jgi:thioredoxin reductase (NADPH)